MRGENFLFISFFFFNFYLFFFFFLLRFYFVFISFSFFRTPVPSMLRSAAVENANFSQCLAGRNRELNVFRTSSTVFQPGCARCVRRCVCLRARGYENSFSLKGARLSGNVSRFDSSFSLERNSNSFFSFGEEIVLVIYFFFLVMRKAVN